jgi:hypothetical protein
MLPSEHMVSLRRAVPGDAQKIAAVFDAAVREAWTYLGPPLTLLAGLLPSLFPS